MHKLWITTFTCTYDDKLSSLRHAHSLGEKIPFILSAKTISPDCYLSPRQGSLETSCATNTATRGSANSDGTLRGTIGVRCFPLSRRSCSISPHLATPFISCIGVHAAARFNVVPPAYQPWLLAPWAGFQSTPPTTGREGRSIVAAHD